MPAVIRRGLPEQYKLNLPGEYDPDGDTYVVIKPSTVADNATRDDLWSKQRRTYNANMPNAMTIESEATFSQRQALEVFLTLVDCNIMWQDLDKDGKVVGEPKLLFKFKKEGGAQMMAMSRNEFLESWGKLPQVVADEIHRCTLLKNPQWDLFRIEPGSEAKGS